MDINNKFDNIIPYTINILIDEVTVTVESLEITKKTCSFETAEIATNKAIAAAVKVYDAAIVIMNMTNDEADKCIAISGINQAYINAKKSYSNMIYIKNKK